MKTDGGFAFPSSAENCAPEFGMTLRDWFAGQWLSGALADPEFNEDREKTAQLAYKQADAMLEARQK